MNRRFLTLLSLIITLLVLGQQANGADSASTITTITLKSTVRLSPDHASVTMADIATITGPQADVVKALPINTDKPIAVGQWSAITSESIRTAIEDSPTINAGSVMLVGSDISLTRKRETTTHNTSTPKHLQPAQKSEPTIQDLLERWIYARKWLNSTPESTRITFGNSSRDQRLLNMTATNRQVIITEIGRSKKISCQITILEGDVLIIESNIRFDVLVERQVRIATKQIRRNELVDQERSTIETRWLSPMTSIADPTDSLAKACKKTIDPGSILLSSMLEQPILIKRGKIVSARSLSGTVSVTMSVRALSDGRLGEIIELESRDRSQRFSAKVAGIGRVIIIQKNTK